jgi:hypothetical protein
VKEKEKKEKKEKKRKIILIAQLNEVMIIGVGLFTYILHSLVIIRGQRDFQRVLIKLKALK